MNEQAAEVAALADQLLAAGRVDELVDQLADPDVASLWDNPDVVMAIAEAHGRHVASSRLMDVVVLRGGGASLLLPLPGQVAPAARIVGAAIVLDGLLRGPAAAEVVYVVDPEVRRVATHELDLRPVGGIDPGAALSRVGGLLPAEPADLLPVDTDPLLARAGRFLAHELVGVAEGALALALNHVQARHQFGVPIGAFQAVRHRLSDAHVQIVAARELLGAIPPAAGLDVHLLVLKPAAGAAALAAVSAAQQVCGGMGFTEEFGLHRFVRRAYVLDSLLGGTEAADGLLGSLALGGTLLPDRQVVLS